MWNKKLTPRHLCLTPEPRTCTCVTVFQSQWKITLPLLVGREHHHSSLSAEIKSYTLAALYNTWHVCWLLLHLASCTCTSSFPHRAINFSISSLPQLFVAMSHLAFVYDSFGLNLWCCIIHMMRLASVGSRQTGRPILDCAGPGQKASVSALLGLDWWPWWVLVWGHLR